MNEILYVLFEENENGKPDYPAMLSVHRSEKGAKVEMEKMSKLEYGKMWITPILLEK